MKRFCFVLLLAGLLGGMKAQAQQYFTNNFGFDDQATTSETVTDVIDSTSFAPWRAYSLGGHTSTFAVKAEPTAPSAPNVFEFSTSGGAWLNEVLDIYDHMPLNLTAGNVYELSFWARAMDSTDHMFSVVAYYKPDGTWNGPPQFQTPYSLTNNWQHFETSFTLPAGTSGVDPQFGCDIPNWDIQMDSIQLEDVTYSNSNRVLNGGFEDSTTGIPGWIVTTAGGNDYSATLVTSDFAEGKQSVKVSQTATPSGSDGVLSTVMLPWKGSDQMKLTLKLKDVTGISANDYAQIYVPAFDASGTFLGVNAGTKIVKPGNGSWTAVDDVVTDLPASTQQIQIAIRITDASGNMIPGDFLVDDVVANDTSQVKVPVELSSFSLN